MVGGMELSRGGASPEHAGIAGSGSAPWGRPLISELLESIPDPVIGCDVKGFVVYWSPAAAEIYGYSAEEAIGQRVVKLLQTRFPLPLLEIMEEVTDLGRWQGSLVHRAKDGLEHTVESRWVARYDGAGRLVGGFGIERELSGLDDLQPARARPEAEQERVERELRRADRLEGLGQLAGGMAHDFNNALAIIINYAGFIDGELEHQHRVSGQARWASMRQDLGEIQTAAQHAAALTHALVAFSGQEVRVPSALSLNASIGEIEELLRSTVGERIRLVTSLADDLNPLRADPAQIQQVLVRLAANARDAMPRGGTLTVDTANVELDRESAAVRPGLAPGAYVRLRVSDTGVGMAPSVLERAFDPFFTTKPVGRGTGLGLSTVYGIITQAGGDAQVYSEPGVGTTFVALLPAGPGATSGDPARVQEPVLPAVGAGTILVVEDERALRKMARRILAGAGYDVIDAEDGPAALAAAAAHDGAIDILLTDVMMPGMLGNELADRLRALRPAIRVLYMSAFSETVLGQATQIGTAILIQKPFTAPVLLENVSAALALSE